MIFKIHSKKKKTKKNSNSNKSDIRFSLLSTWSGNVLLSGPKRHCCIQTSLSSAGEENRTCLAWKMTSSGANHMETLPARMQRFLQTRTGFWIILKTICIWAAVCVSQVILISGFSQHSFQRILCKSKLLVDLSFPFIHADATRQNG